MWNDAKEGSSDEHVVQSYALDDPRDMTQVERQRPMEDWILEARESLSRDMAAVPASTRPTAPVMHREAGDDEDGVAEGSTDVQARPQFDGVWAAEEATAAYSRALVNDAVVEQTSDGPALRVDEVDDEGPEAGLETTTSARPPAISGVAYRALERHVTDVPASPSADFSASVASPGPPIEALSAPAPPPLVPGTQPSPLVDHEEPNALTPVGLAVGMALLMAALLHWVL